MTDESNRELACQIVELFDDFLEEKGIEVPCSDQTEESERHIDCNEAKLYGSEFWDLVNQVERTINSTRSIFAQKTPNEMRADVGLPPVETNVHDLQNLNNLKEDLGITPKSSNEAGKTAAWIIRSIGKFDNQDVKGAQCSNCGFMHPIVHGSNKELYSVCPTCKAKMSVREE